MNLKILIADDDPMDRVLFKNNIRKPGFDLDILEASSAEEALSMISEHEDLSCVFLDYMMPDMDGISVLKRIYDEGADLAPFPVVMLTGYGSEAVAIDAIRYGAQDYLIKDNITTDTLYIALAKAREVFDLKRNRNDALAVLEHSQKMDAVGQLTGGIAHDFNNLLTIIFGNTRLLEMGLHKDSVDKEFIEKKIEVIEKAAKRGADLIKRLMLFSRQRVLDPETIDVNDLIVGLEDLLERSLGEMINFKTDLSADVYDINVDPGQMEHAIINIGVNARDVMLDGGDFIIKTENVQVDGAVAEKLKLEPGPFVKLTLSDTGTGIPDHVVEKIFDPFFTTKDVGKGTGLGLSMVYGFIQESGGAIGVESKKGEGTSFHLYFPKSQMKVENKHLDQIPIEEGGVNGSETILVVEDEDEIRRITVDLMEKYGYRVLEAANGHEAIDVLRGANESIDLVFTDIAMPGEMNGVQMAARAEVLQPNIKLFFTTGYAKDAVPDMHLAERYAMINKPYDPVSLMRKLREVLDAE